MASTNQKDSKTVSKRKNSFVRPYRRFGSIIPKGIVSYFEKKLVVAGIDEDTRVWVGQRALLAFLVGWMVLLSYLITYDPVTTAETALTAVFAWSLGFFGVFLLFYLKLYFQIIGRANSVERILPDFLLLTVSNLRAGMSPFAAFVHAAKPEFGAIYGEVTASAIKAGGKTSLTDALTEISGKFESQLFTRTVMLFAKGIKSGGQLAKLLTSSAEEVRRVQDLRNELIVSTRTYTIFLAFIIIVMMPFLLAVSNQFLTMFVNIQSESGGEVDPSLLGNAPTFSGKIKITPEEMFGISIMTLALTSFLVSGLIGIIGKGQPLYGIKYFPFIAIASIIAFFIAKTLVGGILSTFSGA